MSGQDILNIEFEVKLGDKVFVMKALSLSSIFKLCEKLVKKQYIEDAKEISEALPEKERGKFMLDVWQKIPRNTDIIDIAQEKLATLEGIMEILKYSIMQFNDIKEEELNKLINTNVNASNLEYYTDTVLQVIGLKQEKEESEEKEDKKK